MNRTRSSLLLLVLVSMVVVSACAKEKKTPAAADAKTLNSELEKFEADPKKWAKDNPAEADLARKVRDGKLSPEEAVKEYLGRDGGSGDGAVDSADPEGGLGLVWPAMPDWLLYIPFGLALLVVLGCLVDLARRLAGPRPSWGVRPGVNFKHFVPKPPEPPNDPTFPPEPPVEDGDRLEPPAESSLSLESPAEVTDSAEPPENLFAA
jgi:outer membrane murein-binding lipoprotein Lpp